VAGHRPPLLDRVGPEAVGAVLGAGARDVLRAPVDLGELRARIDADVRLPTALKRAGRIAGGWLAQFSMEDLSEEVVGAGVDALRAAASGPNRGRKFRVAVRVTGAQQRLDELARRLRALAAAGATDVIVDVDWDRDDGPARAFEALRWAVA